MKKYIFSTQEGSLKFFPFVQWILKWTEIFNMHKLVERIRDFGKALISNKINNKIKKYEMPKAI